MDRGEINITIIDYLRPYGPERIGIFGSYARREKTRSFAPHLAGPGFSIINALLISL